MYLRHTRRRKDGKTHVYWQLVRSVRRGRKVVQQTVAQLGELDLHLEVVVAREAVRSTGTQHRGADVGLLSGAAV